MIEDALRETFAAKAGDPPSGSLHGSLHGLADVAIRNAGRTRRRRRAAMTGLTSFVIMAIATVAMLRVLSPAGSPVREAGAQPGQTQPPTSQPTVTLRSDPPAVAREIEAIDGQALTSKKVHLQLPDNGTVAAAYKTKDGYLVVNTSPGGDKQLVLQDEHNKQQVLVKEATTIAVAKDGGTIAWAQDGTMTVASRPAATATATTPAATATSASPSASATPLLTKKVTASVPQTATPVTFVGADLVMGREDGAGFDVWYSGHDYTQSWDPSVLRIFGAVPSSKGVYAEIKPVGNEQAMCLALLALDQPFKVQQHRCGLPVAAKAGGRISPDGHWLAYPIDGLKQVAMIDLTQVFGTGTVKTWMLPVTTRTMWINEASFVVESGGKFLAITPTSPAGTTESLDGQSDGVVLIEPLEAG